MAMTDGVREELATFAPEVRRLREEERQAKEVWKGPDRDRYWGRVERMAQAVAPCLMGRGAGVEQDAARTVQVARAIIAEIDRQREIEGGA